MRTIRVGSVQRFQCEICGYHYPTAELAEQCEAWCREHASCNLAIIQQGDPAPAGNN